MIIEKFLEEYCNEESVLLSQRIAIRRFFTIAKEIKTRRIKKKKAIYFILENLYGITEEELEQYLEAMNYISRILKRKPSKKGKIGG
jgi:antitoxin component HigA of HigAB toxin-antitoxin module